MTATIEQANAAQQPPSGDPPGSSIRALLIGAPLLMALGRALLVPLDDQDWPGTLRDSAAHAGRSDVGWAIAALASAFLACSAMFFARRLYTNQRRKAAWIGFVFTVTGWTGCAAICGGAFVLPYLGKTADRAAQVAVLKDLNGSVGAGLVFLMCVAGAIGYIVMAVSLARAGLTSKGAATLFTLGGAGTLLTMPGPLTPLLVATALVLCAGHAMSMTDRGPIQGRTDSH